MVLPNGQFRVVFTPKNYMDSVAFYQQGLELPIDHQWDYGAGDMGTVFIAGTGMIELLGMQPGYEYVQPIGIGLLIEVDSADRWHTLAQQRGLKVQQEPVSYPWGQRILRLIDPDGVVISLFAPEPVD